MTLRTSTVIWSVLLGFLALLGLLAAVVGPPLFREIRAVAAPIAGLSQSARAIETLNRELPFETPADNLVSEERLLVFLDVWDELRPQHERWMKLVDEKEHPKGQSWEEAKAALGATQEVQRTQVETLRSHKMSAAEFVWLEETVLSSWWERIAPILSSPGRPAVVEELRRAGKEDLRFLTELESRHGQSPAIQAMKERLGRRLASLESSIGPDVPDVPAANQKLFWRHRDRIASIGDPSRYPLHAILQGRRNVSSRSPDRGNRHARPPVLNLIRRNQ